MKGGTYLGEGTYGCTLDPGPACSGPIEHLPGVSKVPRHATVAKVFNNTKAALEEWQMATELAHIDPKQEHFLYPLSRCNTTLGKMANVEGAMMCASLHKRIRTSSKHASGKQPLQLLQLPNGGIPLHHYVQQQNPSPQEMLISMLPVFRGVAKLGRYGIVHNDLKFDNILWNPTTKECRIIDFGICVRTKDALSVQRNPYIFSNYWLHPPEYKIIASMDQRMWAPMDTASVRQMMSDHLATARLKLSSRDPRYLSDMILDGNIFAYCDYEKAYVQYMGQLAKRKGVAAMSAYMGSQPQKIDVYGLGLTLLQAMQHTNMTHTKEVVRHRVFAMVRGMIHPNPRKRHSIQRCIRDVAAILAL